MTRISVYVFYLEALKNPQLKKIKSASGCIPHTAEQGSGSLVLRHSVPDFSRIIQDIACRMAELNGGLFTLVPKQRNENIKKI